VVNAIPFFHFSERILTTSGNSGLCGVYRAKEGARSGRKREKSRRKHPGLSPRAHSSFNSGYYSRCSSFELQRACGQLFLSCLAGACGFGWHRCHLNVLFAPEPKSLLHTQLWFLNSIYAQVAAGETAETEKNSDARSPPTPCSLLLPVSLPRFLLFQGVPSR
jgi:hypothetical protein